MGRKMKRSKRDKVIAGVCGGLSEFFDIDVTIIRLGFVFATLFGGIGPGIYIVLLFIMPEGEGYSPNNFFDEDNDTYSDDQYDSDKDFTHVMGDDMDYDEKDSKKSSTFVGVCLILFGFMLLLKQFIPKISFVQLLPVLLVLIGLIIVFRDRRK